MGQAPTTTEADPLSLGTKFGLYDGQWRLVVADVLSNPRSTGQTPKLHDYVAVATVLVMQISRQPVSLGAGRSELEAWALERSKVYWRDFARAFTEQLETGWISAEDGF